MDKQNRAKTIAVVGSSFYGKTSIIQYTKNYMNINNKRKIKIDNIYFQAFKDTELLSATDKSLGIIAENIDEKM